MFWTATFSASYDGTVSMIFVMMLMKISPVVQHGRFVLLVH